MKTCNEKEKESKEISKNIQDKFSATSSNFHTIFNNSKSSLSKLLQSVYNYNKRTCNALKIDINNKNCKQIKEEMTKKNDEEIAIDKNYNEINEKKLTRNPSISSMTSFTSNISNKYENKKYVSLASYTFLNINNNNGNKYKLRKKILNKANNNQNNNSCIDKKNINFNLNNNDKKEFNNKEINKIIDQLLSLEQNTLNLLTKIKIPLEFHKECTIWINKFTKTCLNEFNKYFYINKGYNSLNNNSLNISGIIKNYDFKNNEILNHLKDCINILVMSVIIGFWRTDDINIDLNENININNIENIIKDLSEIMITHQKLYLLLCLWILKDSNYFNCDINFLNNEEKIILLKEQMKKYLPKKIYGNNFYYINNNLIYDELKSSFKILYSILKIILTENRNNNKIYKLIKYINNLKEIETSELVNYFYDYINSNKNIYIDSSNNLNINEYQNNIDADVNTYQIGSISFNKKTIYNLNEECIIHRRIQSNISSINSISKDDFPYNKLNNNYINNQKDKYNNYQYINNNNYSFNKSNYSNTFSTKNIFNQNKYNNTNFNNYINVNDTTNIKDNYTFNCRNKINNSYYNIKPKPPYLSNINSKNKKYQKKLTLILDLDETLVRFKINEYNIQTGNVVLRPGLIQFLNKVYPLFDLVIWTVATKQYADAILDIIERDKKYFSARLYREHATIDEKNNLYIKDLNNLGRPLDSIIIIDDKEISYKLHKENGILIKPFMGSKLELQKDFVLFDLFTILTKILLDKSKDVRIGISNFKYEIQQKISNINCSKKGDKFCDN